MFKVFLILTRNELRGYFRSKASLFWAFIFPILLLTVMLMAFGKSSSLGQANIAFSGDLASPSARSCRAEIEAAFSGSNTVTAKYVTDVQLVKQQDDLLNIVFSAPNAQGISNANVRYDFNGSLALKAASRIVEIAMTRCVGRAQGIEPSEVVHFEDMSTGKPAFDAGNFFVTGILVMAFMSIGMISTATNIASLREHNTFKIYVCLPVSRTVFLASMVCARLMIMLFSAISLLLVARFVFGIDLPLWQPRMLHAIPIVVLGAIMLLCFGLMLASRARSLSEAELWCNATYYPLLFFSDLTIPLRDAPSWVKTVLKAIPTNEFAVTLRGVLIDGLSLGQIGIPFTAMLAWTAFFFFAATVSFKWHHE
jgi:ABC-2 type transport system permease protein